MVRKKVPGPGKNVPSFSKATGTAAAVGVLICMPSLVNFFTEMVTPQGHAHAAAPHPGGPRA